MVDYRRLFWNPLIAEKNLFVNIALWLERSNFHCLGKLKSGLWVSFKLIIGYNERQSVKLHKIKLLNEYKMYTPFSSRDIEQPAFVFIYPSSYVLRDNLSSHSIGVPSFEIITSAKC